MKTKRLFIITFGLLALAALCAAVYFTFIAPPGENKLAGAQFVQSGAWQNGC